MEQPLSLKEKRGRANRNTMNVPRSSPALYVARQSPFAPIYRAKNLLKFKYPWFLSDKQLAVVHHF